MHAIDGLLELRSQLVKKLQATLLKVGFVLNDLQLNLAMEEDKQSRDALNILYPLVCVYLLADLVALLKVAITLLEIFFFKIKLAQFFVHCSSWQ